MIPYAKPSVLGMLLFTVHLRAFASNLLTFIDLIDDTLNLSGFGGEATPQVSFSYANWKN